MIDAVLIATTNELPGDRIDAFCLRRSLVPRTRDSHQNRVSGAAGSGNDADMDDAADNIIPLSRRALVWEELVNAVDWLDDLDSPLQAEQIAAPVVTASERIRRVRELRESDADRTPAA
jgi:hypothetical protein